MKRPSGPRKTAYLSWSMHFQLNSYALTASAAGVGMLALARPAEAKIVYTPANIHIKIDNGVTELDLNHDGINDFKFSNFANECGAPRAGTFDCNASLHVAPALPLNREVEIKGNTRYCASALPKGVKVGPSGPFRSQSSGLNMAYENTGGGTYSCPWRPVKLAYLGVKFVVSGKVHFGWVRIKRLSGAGFPATITGYAYETIPNKPIITGKTKGTDDLEGSDPSASLTAPAPDNRHQATLGVLALGAAGGPLWRRKAWEGASVSPSPQ